MVRIALAFARRTPIAPFFGPTTGIWVNFTPDRAVRYSLDGTPLGKRASSYRPGEAEVRIGGGKLALGESS